MCISFDGYFRVLFLQLLFFINSCLLAGYCYRKWGVYSALFSWFIVSSSLRTKAKKEQKGEVAPEGNPISFILPWQQICVHQQLSNALFYISELTDPFDKKLSINVLLQIINLILKNTRPSVSGHIKTFQAKPVSFLISFLINYKVPFFIVLHQWDWVLNLNLI